MSLPGRLVDTTAGRIFVHQAGSGPPLVLVHGMFVSHWYFRPVIRELARHHSVIAVDLPGFGESDRPAPSRFRYDATGQAALLVELLDKLGIERAHVVGHSMGGAVALSLTARHGRRVDRLVVEDPWVYPIDMPWLARIALQPLIGGLLFKRVYGRRDLVRHFKTCYHDPSLVSEELVDYYWERMTRAGGREAGHDALASFSAVSQHNPDPARVHRPTLILWGENDTIFPVAHGHRLVGEVPGAELRVIAACGHSPHEERPEEYLRHVLPFLLGRTVEAAAPSEEAASGA